MNDAENMSMILGNFYRAISRSTEALIDRNAEDRHNLNHDDRFAVGCRYCESEQHSGHASASEEGYVDADCTICLHDNPEWVADRENARRSTSVRSLPVDPRDDPREAFAEKIEQF